MDDVEEFFPSDPEAINAGLSGLERALHLRYTEVSADRVVVECDVADHLRQPIGLVHGGVYAALSESAASRGAVANSGGMAVGVNNTTDFIRSVREGTLRAIATPLQPGRRTQLWQVEIFNLVGQSQPSLVARSTVRTMPV